jgi:hypothetical protein
MFMSITFSTLLISRALCKISKNAHLQSGLRNPDCISTMKKLQAIETVFTILKMGFAHVMIAAET